MSEREHKLEVALQSLEWENDDLRKKLKIAENKCYQLFEENHYLNYKLSLYDRNFDNADFR